MHAVLIWNEPARRRRTRRLRRGGQGRRHRHVRARTSPSARATASRQFGDFAALTPERARTLGAQYGLDYLVAEQPLDLPLAFESGKLRCIGFDRIGIRDSGFGTRDQGLALEVTDAGIVGILGLRDFGIRDSGWDLAAERCVRVPTLGLGRELALVLATIAAGRSWKLGDCWHH